MPLSSIRQRVVNGCQHIMASNFDKGWVALVILHFVIQVTLQGLTLRDNMQAKDVTNLCLSLAQAPSGLALLKSDGLNMCDGIPGHANVTCILLASRIASPPSLPEAMTPRSLTSFDLDGISSITIAGVEHSLTGRCALSLHWIHDIFRDNVAEDVATLCFQFWLLIVSLLAVLQDSIPHLAVCMASHMLDAAWVGSRIKSTITLRRRYYRFVVDGACGGEDMLGTWWDQRLAHAAPLFATNVIILILLGVLSVVLFRRFARINFSRAGAPASITRMYKIALAFSAFLQLAAFSTVMAVGMWIDRVSSGPINDLVNNIQAYQAIFIVLAVIVTPWIVSGWWGIFREIRWAFSLFAGLHLFILALWPIMFASPIYRYVFGTWTFFASVSLASYLFLLATAVMTVICRMNFGKGLEHFMRVEAALSSIGFPPSYFANDPSYVPSGSPISFDLGLLKGRDESGESGKEGLMNIRPYTLDSSGYSMHSLMFETSTNSSKIPVATPPTPPGDPSAAILRALKKGGVKPIPKVNTKYEPRPKRAVPKSTIFTPDEKKSWIQPPPEAFLHAPHKEFRSRKETPSLMTQATVTSTNSYAQAVISYAKKNPFVTATPRTLLMNTVASRNTPTTPGEAVTSREVRPGIDPGTGVPISTAPLRRPTLVSATDDTQGVTQFAAPADWETTGGTGRGAPPRVDFSPHSESWKI